MVGRSMLRLLKLLVLSFWSSMTRDSRKFSLVAEGPNKGLVDLKEFIEAIRKEYPDLQIVEGTHPFHDLDGFKAGIKELATQKAVTPQKMNDLVFKRIKIHTEEDEEKKG